MKKLLIFIAAVTVSLNNAEEIKQSADFAAVQLNYLIKDTLKQEQYNNDVLITNWQRMGVIIHRIVNALYYVDRLKSAIEEDNSLASQYLGLLQEAQRCLERFDAQKLIYINQVNMYCGHAIAMEHPNFELAEEGKIKIPELQKEARLLCEQAVILEDEVLISKVQAAIHKRLDLFILFAKKKIITELGCIVSFYEIEKRKVIYSFDQILKLKVKGYGFLKISQEEFIKTIEAAKSFVQSHINDFEHQETREAFAKYCNQEIEEYIGYKL